MKTIRLSSIAVLLGGAILAFPYVLNGLDLGSVECRVCPGETLESSALLLLLIGFPLCTVVGLVSSLALVVFGVVLFSRFDAL